MLAALFTRLLSGCAAIPDVNAMVHTNPLYLVNPSFVGPHGPLTAHQAQRIISRLELNEPVQSNILERHLAFEQAISNEPLVVGNQVSLLNNGAVTYQAMLTAIRAARDSINIEMFTFTDGPIGLMFASALIERQQHGVQVNIIYDGLGSLGTSAAFFDKMRQAGIAILEYRPVNPLMGKLSSLYHRDHRKLLIVDGHVAFTGGINISEVYASQPVLSNPKGPPEYWRDTDIEVTGPVVAQFQRLFVNEWRYQKGPPLSRRIYFPYLTAQGHDIVRALGSVPERFSLIYVTLVSAIISAQSNVYITDAYFAPDHQMVVALQQAARRGVDVRVLLPSQSDEALIVWAQRSDYQELLRAGVKIYEWQGKMLHSKTATVDGVWSTVGTSNLDWWSIARDNELNAVILSDKFGGQMNAMFFNDMKGSKQIDPEQWRQRSIAERIKETSAWMIEPAL